jgi:hypothetical protein
MSTPVYEEEQPIIEENEVEEEPPIIEENEFEEKANVEENEVEEKANVEEEKAEETNDNTNIVRRLFADISDISNLVDKSPIYITLLSPAGKAYTRILYILSNSKLDNEFVTAWMALFRPYIELYLDATIEIIKKDLEKYEESPEDYEDEIPVYKFIISHLRDPVDEVEKNTDIQDLDIVKQFTKRLHDKLDTLDAEFAGFEKSKKGGKPKRKTRKSRKSKCNTRSKK